MGFGVIGRFPAKEAVLLTKGTALRRGGGIRSVNNTRVAMNNIFEATDGAAGRS